MTYARNLGREKKTESIYAPYGEGAVNNVGEKFRESRGTWGNRISYVRILEEPIDKRTENFRNQKDWGNQTH